MIPIAAVAITIRFDYLLFKLNELQCPIDKPSFGGDCTNKCWKSAASPMMILKIAYFAC